MDRPDGVPADCGRADGAFGHFGPVPARRGGPPLRPGTRAFLLVALAAAACTGADDAGETGEGPSSGTAAPPSDRSGEPAADPPADTADAPGPGAPADAPAPPELIPLPDDPAEACTAVLEHGLAIEARTRGALRAELGEPDSVWRAAVPNRHISEATDTVVTMRWPDATAVVRVAQSKELVDAIRVTDVRHLRYAGVGPGTPRDSILVRLGDPGRRVGGGEPVPIGRSGGDPSREAPPEGAPDPAAPDAGTLSYWCPSEPGAESPVLFHVRDGRVAAVEWDFYVD